MSNPDIVEAGKATQFTSDKQPEGAGRKKGSLSLTTLLRELIEREIVADDPIDKVKCKMPVGKVILLRLIANAVKGDNRALQEVMDRLEGKALQKIANVGVEKIIVEYVDGDKNSSDKRVPPEQGSGGRSDSKDNSESGRGEIGQDVRNSPDVDNEVSAGNEKDADDKPQDKSESAVVGDA